MSTLVNASELALLSPEQQAAVRAELRAILGSSHFAGSRRCQDLLTYVVDNALSGSFSQLSERFIGKEVFGRQVDYETATDAVVRVRANDARRRLAQYEAEDQSSSLVRIRLYPGSYVPEFFFRSSEENALASASEATLSLPLLEPTGRASAASPLEMVTTETIQHHPKPIYWSRRLWLVALGAMLALISVSVGKIVRNVRRDVTPLNKVWQPMLDDPGSVLMTIGRPHMPGDTQEIAPENLTIRDHFYQPAFRVTITTASAVSQVSGLLQSRQKPYRIHDADTVALDDLHKRPVIPVNAVNNKWTMRLLQPLRFSFESVDTDGDFTYIRDDEHPSNHDWRVDWQQPLAKQTADYAIIGRFYDATTAGPVIVIAGISSNGTEAAAEFIASPAKLDELARITHNSLARNFEAVLKVEVVGGNTGAVSVVGSKFW